MLSDQWFLKSKALCTSTKTKGAELWKQELSLWWPEQTRQSKGNVYPLWGPPWPSLCVGCAFQHQSPAHGAGPHCTHASIQSAAFWPFTVWPQRGPGTRCQKRKWKAKLNLCGPFSGCWMSHYYISAWHFTASRGGGPVLKAEQTQARRPASTLTVSPDLWIKDGGFVSIVSLVPCKNNNLSLFDVLTYFEK